MSRLTCLILSSEIDHFTVQSANFHRIGLVPDDSINLLL